MSRKPTSRKSRLVTPYCRPMVLWSVEKTRIPTGQNLILPEMPAPDRAEPGHHREADFTRTYVLVVVIQILVVAALYWFGRHFS
jgi:hypothetical protein